MRLLITVAALLLATPAWAELPVASDADHKTLKKNLLFGDPLAFELYETADCTGAPVYSEILGQARRRSPSSRSNPFRQRSRSRSCAFR